MTILGKLVVESGSCPAKYPDGGLCGCDLEFVDLKGSAHMVWCPMCEIYGWPSPPTAEETEEET